MFSFLGKKSGNVDGAKTALQEQEERDNELAAMRATARLEEERLKAESAAKVKRIPEYDFPADQAGRELRELWEHYEDKCIEHNMERRFPERSSEVTEALQAFMIKFIAVFHYDAYDDLCEEARALVVFPEGEAVPRIEPDSSARCPGMPSRIVREFANLLLDLFGGYIGPSPAGRGLQYQHVIRKKGANTAGGSASDGDLTDMRQSASAKFAESPVNTSSFFPMQASVSSSSGHYSSKDDRPYLMQPMITDLKRDRETHIKHSIPYLSTPNTDYGLNLLRCIAIVVSWAHNRYILQRDLGTHFPDVVIDLMDATIRPHFKNNEFNVKDDAKLDAGDLLLSTSALMSLVQILERCQTTSKTFFCFNDFLPCHPWHDRELALMGFQQFGKGGVNGKDHKARAEIVALSRRASLNDSADLVTGLQSLVQEQQMRTSESAAFTGASTRGSQSTASAVYPSTDTDAALKTSLPSLDTDVNPYDEGADDGRGSGGGSIDSDDIQIEIDMGGTSIGLGSMLDTDSENNDWLLAFVTSGRSIQALTSVLNGVTKIINTMELESPEAKLLLPTLFVLEAEVLHTMRIHLTFVPPAVSVQQYKNFDCGIALGVLLQRRTAETRIDRRNPSSVWTEEDHAFFSYVYLRLGITCFAIVDAMHSQAKAWKDSAAWSQELKTEERRMDMLDYMSGGEFPMTTTYFAHFLLNMKKDCDSVPLKSVVVADAANPASLWGDLSRIKISCDFRANFKDNSFSKCELWPWSNSRHEDDDDGDDKDIGPYNARHGGRSKYFDEAVSDKLGEDERNAKIEEIEYRKKFSIDELKGFGAKRMNETFIAVIEQLEKTDPDKASEYQKAAKAIRSSPDILRPADLIRNVSSNIVEKLTEYMVNSEFETDDFHLVSQFSDAEMTAYAAARGSTASASPTRGHSANARTPARPAATPADPRNDHWDWATVGPGPMAWSYLFRSMYRIFCQDHNFRNIGKHKETFEFLIMTFCEAGVPELREQRKSPEDVAADYQEEAIGSAGLGTSAVVYNQDADPAMLELPLMQHSFLQFIYIIIDTDPVVTLHAIADSKFWLLLRGQMFLGGGRNIINTNMSRFTCTETKSEHGLRMKKTYTHGSTPQCLQCAAWITMHDKILDLLLVQLKAAFVLESKASSHVHEKDANLKEIRMRWEKERNAGDERDAMKLSKKISMEQVAVDAAKASLKQALDAKEGASASVLVSAMLIITTFNAVPSATGEYSYSQPSDSILCGGVKWLKYILTDKQFPWEKEQKSRLFDNICMSMTSLSNRLMLSHIGINRLIADRAPFNFNEAKNPFLWPCRVLIVEFILLITQGSNSVANGASLMAALVKGEMLDKGQSGIRQNEQIENPAPESIPGAPPRGSSPQQQSSMARIDQANSKTLSARIAGPPQASKSHSEEYHISCLRRLGWVGQPFEVDAADLMQSSRMRGRAPGAAPFHPTISTNDILLLLLDPRLKEAAMHLVFRIVYATSVRIERMERRFNEARAKLQMQREAAAQVGIQSDNRERLEREAKDKERHKNDKHELLKLIGTLLLGVLDIVTNCANFPSRCDAFNTSLYCLGTLTWMTTSSVMSPFHYLLKDIMHRTSSVSHLFAALGTCADGVRMNPKPVSSTTGVPVQPLPQIHRQTMALLTTLMTQHDGNAQAFSEQIRQVKSSLVNSAELFTNTLRDFERLPSLETIIVLLEMLLSSTFPREVHNRVLAESNPTDVMLAMEKDTQTVRYKIINQAVIPCIFCVLRYCKPETQLFILNFFNSLTTGKSSLVNYNLNECSTSNVLDLCIENINYLKDDEVQQQNVLLIRTLGRHKITVSDLKYIFRNMQHGHQTGSGLKYHWMLLESMRDMITDITGPKCKIVFGGQNSGLMLPEVSKWAAMKGFSMCFWFKLEIPTDLLGTDEENKLPRRAGSGRSTKGISALRFQRSQKSIAMTPDYNSMYEPHLLSMMCSDGSGIEISLQPIPSSRNFQLNLHGFLDKHSHSEYAKNANTSNRFDFEYAEKDKGHPLIVSEGLWHYLAVTISPPGLSQTSIFGRATIPATIVLDKRSVTGHFPTPKFGGFVKTVIGDSIHVRSPRGTAYQRGDSKDDDDDDDKDDAEMEDGAGSDEEKREEKVQSFRGQTGAIYFFSNMLTPSQLSSIRELGCDYFYCFEPYTARYIKNSPKVDFSIFNEQYGLMKSVMLSYNPAVKKGDLFLNNPPENSNGSGVTWQVVNSGGDHDAGDSAMHAECRSNTFSTTTQDVRKALDSLGGLSALLPILFNIDSNISTIQIPERFRILPSLLSLLNSLLRDKKYKTSLMSSLHGFAVISTLIEGISIRHFTPECLQRIFDINDDLTMEGEEAAEVRNSLLLEILFKLHLWRFTPLPLQLTLLNYLIKFTAADPQRARQVMSPNKFLDIIFWNFSYTDEATKCSTEYDFLMQSGCPEEFLGDTKRDPDGTDISRPNGWERILLRSKLFQILRTLLVVDTLPEEISHLLGYMVITRCVQAKLEFLQLLVELLQNEAVAPVVLLGLNYSGAIGSILAFGMHDNAKIRLYSLLIICEIIHISGKYARMPDVPVGSKYFNGRERAKTMRKESMSTECLERVGLAPDKLPEILHHLQASLLSKIYQSHYKMKEANNGDASQADKCASYQVVFVASALLKLSFGFSAVSMSAFIKPQQFKPLNPEDLLGRNSQSTGHDRCKDCRTFNKGICPHTSEYEQAEVELANIRAAHASHQYRADEVLDFSVPFKLNAEQVTDCKRISAMPVVTLLTFINNDWMPLQDMFDIAFLLKLQLNTDENSNNLASLHGWHKSIYDIIVGRTIAMQGSTEEKGKVYYCRQTDTDALADGEEGEGRRCDAEAESSSSGSTTATAKHRGDISGIRDLFTDVLFGLNKTALRIGRSLCTPSVCCDASHENELTSKKIRNEYNTGCRTIGSSTLRETVLFIHSMTVRSAVSNTHHSRSTLTHTHTFESNEEVDFSSRPPTPYAPEYSLFLLRSFIKVILESLNERNMELRNDRLSNARSARTIPVTMKEQRSIGISKEDDKTLDFEYECKLHLINVWIFAVTYLDRVSGNRYLDVDHPAKEGAAATAAAAAHAHAHAQPASEKASTSSETHESRLALENSGHASGETPFAYINEVAKQLLQMVKLGVNSRHSQASERANDDPPFPDMPFCNREGGMYWCLLRILCRALINAKFGKDNYEHVLQVLEKLNMLLQHCFAGEFAFAAFEQYYVLATLSHVLFEFEFCTSIEFVAPLRRFFQDLLRRCRTGVMSMLSAALGRKHAMQGRGSGSGNGSGSADNRVEQHIFVSPFSEGDPIASQDMPFFSEIKLALFTDASGHPVEFFEGLPTYPSDSPSPSASADGSSPLSGKADSAVSSKKVPVKESVLQALTREVWVRIMEDVLEQGQLTHVLFESKVLEELNLGYLCSRKTDVKQLGEDVSLIHTHNSMDHTTWTMSEFLTNCRSSQESFYVTHLTNLKDLFRGFTKRSKRYLLEGKAKLSTLNNERGPWGSFRSEERVVFWRMDLTDNFRSLLIPEDRANQHRNASRIQASGKNNAAAIERMETIDQSLSKYQTKKSNSAALEIGDGTDKKNEDNDNFGDEDDFALGALPTADAKDVVLGAVDDVLFEANVQVVTMVTQSGGSSLGTLEVTRRCISYKRLNENLNIDLGAEGPKGGNDEYLWACELFPTTEWPIDHLKFIFDRMYQMQPIAVEISFIGRQSVFLAFENAATCKKLVQILKYMVKPANLTWEYFGRGSTIVTAVLPSLGKSLQEAWICRELTNYEYLMKLNQIAGRSFNDVTQYPVFPWILRDYTSKVLDLKNPNTFRDFRYPAGAQTEEMRKTLKDYYETMLEMDDESHPPCHSGSHYSTPGFTYGYLIRVEPFTSMHVQFQSGKFEPPDRLFKSIPDTWASVIGNNRMDARELIPEFFQSTEFLRNPNSIDLGTTQAGEKLGKVHLPAWAANEYDFIEKHKEALESEHVSRNLHHWIDLMFGYKQRPPNLDGGSEQTVKICNVFPKHTYLNAYNIADIKSKDPDLFKVLSSQLKECGQAPQQLFRDPHPERSPLLALDKKKQDLEMHDIIWPIASSVQGFSTIKFELPKDASKALKDKYEEHKQDKPSFCQCHEDFSASSAPVLFIGEVETTTSLITVDELRLLGKHSFVRHQNDHIPPYKLVADSVVLDMSQGHYKDSSVSNTMKNLVGLSKTNVDRRIGVPFGASKWGIGDSLSAQGRGRKAKGALEHMEAQKKQVIEQEELNKRAEKQRKEREELEKFKAKEARDQKRRQTRTASDMGLTAPDSPAGERMRTETRASVVPGPSSDSSSPKLTTKQSSPRMERTDSVKSVSISDERGGDKYSSAASPGPQQASPPKGTPESTSGKSLAMTSRGSVSSTTSSRSTNPQQPQQQPRTESSAPSKGASAAPKGTAKAHWERERANDHMGPHLFAFLPSHRLLFSCFHWDNSFRVTQSDSCKLLQTVIEHQEIVTCLALASDVCKHWLLTGSEDSTIMVWNLYPDNHDNPIDPVPLHTIHGHDNTVNCIAVNAEMDIIVSGSEDGTMIISSLRTGMYIRTIEFNMVPTRIARKPPVITSAVGLAGAVASTTDVALKQQQQQQQIATPSLRKDAVRSSASQRVNLVAISKEGYIVAYSAQGHILLTYSLNALENGVPFRRIFTGERIYCMRMSEDGKVLMTGGAYCLVILRWVYSLALANDGNRAGLQAVLDGAAPVDERGNIPTDGMKPFNSPIRSMYMTPKEAHLFVGLENGHVRILAQDSEYLRQRLHKRLELTGFLK